MLHDLRYAARLLRRRPAFSVTAIVTLALGIGGATAVFSLLQALLLRTLPVERPHELVRLTEGATGSAQGTPAKPSAGPAGAELFTLVTQTTLQRETRTLSGAIASSASTRPNEVFVRGERRFA